MNTKPAFTAADVAALAKLIAPQIAKFSTDEFASPVQRLEVAVCVAEQIERDAFERRLAHLSEIVGALGGTFDEFRSEVPA